MTASETTTFAAAFILGSLQAWNTYQSRKNSTAIKENTVATKENAAVTKEVHILVNSQMGVTLHSLAQVTAAKAAITKDDTDIQDANEAMAKYLDHVEKQSRVDAKIPDPDA
jgi:uncharacterized membrane protein YjjP (DUF1212 family)